jgi:hypothetical protein
MTDDRYTILGLSASSVVNLFFGSDSLEFPIGTRLGHVLRSVKFLPSKQRSRGEGQRGT